MPSGATVDYGYDADNNRTKVTTVAGSTKYLIDTNRSLAQVLAEYGATGTKASYVYADDLVSMERSGGVYYYHFDGLGSTRVLEDAEEALVAFNDYDAFGNGIGQQGGVANTHLYTGQEYDTNSELYYLRARYYQPTVGRFIAVDPYSGDSHEPLSMHKYLYAANNPLNMVDLSGENYTEAIAAMGIMQTLVSQAILALKVSTVACSAVLLYSALGGDPGGPLNLPCEVPDREIIVYRGLNGTNPGSFRFDTDGMSTFETLPPGQYKCAFPFTLRFKGIKRPGTMAKVVSPVTSCAGMGTYTPPPDGHWSLNYPGDIEGIKKELSAIAKGVCN